MWMCGLKESVRNARRWTQSDITIERCDSVHFLRWPVRRGWCDALSGDYRRVFQGLLLGQKAIKERSVVVFLSSFATELHQKRRDEG